MNKRICVYHENINSFRESYNTITNHYLDASNKFRLCILLGSENTNNLLDFPTYDSKVLIHEVPTMFLTYIHNSTYEKTEQIFVSNQLIEFWWQDVDVWVNLPAPIEKSLKPMSNHLSFLSFSNLAEVLCLR